MQTEQEWLEEIESVKGGILRWITGNPHNAVCQKLSQGFPKSADDLIELDEAIWQEMDAVNWLGKNHRHSDVWQCAVWGAIAKCSE